MQRRTFLTGAACGVAGVAALTPADGSAQAQKQLRVTWEKNFLSIQGDFPGGEVRTHYLEAYCRPGSTDRDWKETVIPHHAELLAHDTAAGVIRLRDQLADGAVVEHRITAGPDEVDFRLVAHNPTDKPSLAHWAQPCMRVDKFTGHDLSDARVLYPKYIKQCFLFVDGNYTRLPTTPWADKARYIPGQVYCPAHVDRNDVNPRPLSSVVPSNGLCGCVSSDGKWLLAVAWEPFQEVFQGVICCIHNDFRIGGLAPDEKKMIRGKVYLVPNDPAALLARFERDFPEQRRRGKVEGASEK